MRTIELKWNCGECDTKGILGRHKSCPSCGSPREKGEMQMDGLGADDYDARGYNKAATVTDPKLLDLAHAGADWFCRHCDSGNRGDGDTCSACGGPRYKTKPTVETTESAFPEPAPAPAPIPPVPGPVPEPEPDPWEDDDYVPEPDVFSPTLPLIFGLTTTTIGAIFGSGLAGLFIIFLIWAFQTHEVEGSISNMHWEHYTTVEKWTDTTVRDWQHTTFTRKEIKPVNGKGERSGMENIGGCVREHHHYEKYQCGTRTEAYECGSNESYSCTKSKSESYACGEICTNNGNGFATCRTKYCSRQVNYQGTCTKYVSKTCQRDVPKYCDRSIKKNKCNYRTQIWKKVHTVPVSGTGDETRWADVQPEPLERLQFRGKYRVDFTFRDRGKDHSSHVRPESEKEYKTYSPGGKVTVFVNNLGGVHHALPKE